MPVGGPGSRAAQGSSSALDAHSDPSVQLGAHMDLANAARGGSVRAPAVTLPGLPTPRARFSRSEGVPCHLVVLRLGCQSSGRGSRGVGRWRPLAVARSSARTSPSLARRVRVAQLSLSFYSTSIRILHARFPTTQVGLRLVADQLHPSQLNERKDPQIAFTPGRLCSLSPLSNRRGVYRGAVQLSATQVARHARISILE